MHRRLRLDRSDLIAICAFTFIAAGWLCILGMAADLGSLAYAAPIVAAGVCFAVIVVVRAARGSPRYCAAVLVFVVFFLSLNFRTRELGDIGLDWQNGIKVATWICLLVLAAARFRYIAPLFQNVIFGLSCIYAVFALTSASWSQDPVYTAASAVGLLAYLGLAGSIVVDIGAKPSLRIMTWALAVFICLGVLGAVVAPDLTWLPPSVEETSYRLQGFSGHPNTFGQQAAVLTILAIVAWRARAISWGSLACLLPVGAFAMLAAGSRTSLLAVIIASICVAIRSTRFGHLWVMSAAGVLGCCAPVCSVRPYFGPHPPHGRA